MEMFITNSAKHFLRGYQFTIQSENLDKETRIEKVSRLFLRELSENNSFAIEYLRMLKTLGFDVWVEDYAEYILSDEKDSAAKEKLFEVYEKITPEEGNRIDYELLDKYDGYPQINEEFKLDTGLKYAEDIWENAREYKWGNLKEDLIIARYLFACVEKTEYILKKNPRYDYPYRGYLNRNENGQYDFSNHSIIKAFLRGDSNIHFDGMEELEELLKKHGKLGKLMHDLVKEKKTWSCLKNALTDKELKTFIYQTAVFYRYCCDDVDEYARFILENQQWLDTDRALIGRFAVRTAMQTNNAELSSALMNWYVSKKEVDNTPGKIHAQNISDIKHRAAKQIYRWLYKLEDERELISFAKSTPWYSSDYDDLSGLKLMMGLPTVEDLKKKVYENIEIFKAGEQELIQLSDGFLLNKYQMILNNLLYFVSPGSVTEFVRDYYHSEIKETKSLLSEINEYMPLDELSVSKEEELMFIDLWTELGEEHLEHVKGILAEKLIQSISEMEQKIETARKDLENTRLELESEKEDHKRDIEQLSFEADQMVKDLEDYYEIQLAEKTKELEEEYARRAEEIRIAAIGEYYSEARKAVEEYIEDSEAVFCKMLYGDDNHKGELLKKLRYNNSQKNEIYKELYTSEITFRLLEEANDPNSNPSIAILPLTKSIEILLRDLLIKVDNNGDFDRHGIMKVGARDRYYDQKGDIEAEFGSLVFLFSDKNIDKKNNKNAKWEDWWNENGKYVDLSVLTRFTGISLRQYKANDRQFVGQSDNNAEKINREILFSALNFVRDKYRNPIAHTNDLKEKDYKDCRDLLINAQYLFWVVLSIIK